MNTRVGKLHWHAVVLATFSMLASIWLIGMVADLADAQGSGDHSDLEHHHGFTGPGGAEDWPPRPVGSGGEMTDADPFAVPAAAPKMFALQAPEAQADGGAAQAEVPPQMAAEMVAVLGENWIRISSVAAKSGKDDFNPAEETYFSRDLNQTVIVRQWPGGPEILVFAPDELQPVITEPERVEATELGRQWLIARGLTQVESLEGFGIRALDNGELYPVRMVYVTYATSWFDDPIYSALVDLTNGVVIEGGAL